MCPVLQPVVAKISAEGEAGLPEMLPETIADSREFSISLKEVMLTIQQLRFAESQKSTSHH